MSIRVPVKTYNIPRRTIFNTNKPDYPLIFSNEEEICFVSCIRRNNKFEFLLNQLPQIIKTFLNKKDRKVPCFRENVPSRDRA